MSARPARYLVLGASGFLGSHILEGLATRPGAPEVLAVSRRLPSAVLGEHGRFISMDLASATVHDLVDLFTVFDPDVVVNCAGATEGTTTRMWHINATFVERLVAALIAMPRVCLIHLGSSAEYGAQASNRPVPEDAPVEPVNTYGRSKLAATQAISSAVASRGLSAVVLRVFNPIGARQPLNSLAGNAAAEMRAAMQNDLPSITLGPLSAQRDFLAAADVAAGVFRAAAAIGVAGSPPPPAVLNLGSGRALSCRALVDALAGAAGFKGAILATNEPELRSVGVSSLAADLSQLKSALSWAPSTPLADALDELWLTEDLSSLV